MKILNFLDRYFILIIMGCAVITAEIGYALDPKFRHWSMVPAYAWPLFAGLWAYLAQFWRRLSQKSTVALNEITDMNDATHIVQIMKIIDNTTRAVQKEREECDKRVAAAKKEYNQGGDGL